MISGRVTGRIWSTRHIDTLPNGALLVVTLEDGARLIALDPLGCNDGEAVLVTQGSVAAGYFTKIKAPVDALIIGSIDEESS